MNTIRYLMRGVSKEVIALSIARLSDAMGNSLLIIIIPLYVAILPSRLNLPKEFLIGILIGMYGLISSVTQPVVGIISDRTQRPKSIIIVGLLLMGIGILGFILARNYTHLIIVRSLQGIAVAMTLPPSLSLMVAYTLRKTRGEAMGFFSTLRLIGFATGPLIGGFLVVYFGFNTAFYFGAGFAFTSLILVLILVPKDKERDIRLDYQKVQTKAFLHTDTLFLGATIATMAACMSMMATLENQFNEKLNQNAIGFSIAFSALTVSRLIFQIPIGKLSDAIGRKKLIIAGSLLLAPATIWLGYVSSTSELTFTRIFQGIATAGIVAPSFALAGDMAPEGFEGRRMSVLTTSFGFGLAFGPLIAGILAGYLPFQVPFYVMGILSFLMAIFVLVFIDESSHHLKKQEMS